MHTISELVLSLNKSEMSLLNTYYKLQSKGKPSRKPELIKLIREGKVRTDEEAAERLYKTKPTTALYNLKKRLTEDVMDIILLAGGFVKPQMDYHEAAFFCRKQLAVAEVMAGRGSGTIAIDLLKEVASVARKYELQSEYISAMDLIRNSLGFRKGIKAYDSHTAQIERAMELHRDILKSQAHSKQVGLTGMFKKNKQQDFRMSAMVMQKELKKIYTRSGSPSVGYWYLRTSVYYYMIIKDFKKALDAAKELLDLIKNEVSINSNARIGFINIQLANILMEMGDFRAAMKFASAAGDAYKNKQVDHLQSMELLFVASVHAGDLLTSRKILAANLTHKQLKINPFIQAKWNFYKANLAFINKDYHQVIKILRFSNMLTKDTGGWLIGYKLLEILALIELRENEIAAIRVNAFRKLLQRIKGQDTARYKLIAALLLRYIKENFAFDVITDKENLKSIRLLQEGKEEYYWDPLAFEIIRFDKWWLQISTSKSIK